MPRPKKDPDLNAIIKEQEELTNKIVAMTAKAQEIISKYGISQMMADVVNESQKRDRPLTNADVHQEMLSRLEKIIPKIPEQDLKDFFIAACIKIFKTGIDVASLAAAMMAEPQEGE